MSRGILTHRFERVAESISRNRLSKVIGNLAPILLTAGLVSFYLLCPSLTVAAFHSLSAPSTAAVGANLTVSWTAPAGSSYYDMIGLYPTETTGSRGAIWSSYTTGARSGSFTLTASTIGTYEFRYFVNQAVYQLAQTSNPVTVTSSSGRNHKLIEWGWDSKLPQYLKRNIASMEQMPFDGTDIKIQYGHPWTGGTDYFGWKVFTSKVLTINDPVLQWDIRTIKSTPFKKFTDNFLDVETSSVHELEFVDWFDDWSTYLNNVTVAAQVAQRAGLKGIILDTEVYQSPQWQYDRQKYASTKTLAQYKAQVLQRGRDVMTAMTSAYPNITVMLTFGSGVVALRKWYDGASFNESAYGYSLVVPFVDGMLQVISERKNQGQNYPRLIEGFESSYDFKTDSLFMTQGYDQIRTGGRSLSSVPDLYDQFYRVGFGTWMRYDWFSPADFDLALGYALNDTESYVWVWSDGSTGSEPDWWTVPPTNIPQAYIDALRSAKSRYLGR